VYRRPTNSRHRSLFGLDPGAGRPADRRRAGLRAAFRPGKTAGIDRGSWFILIAGCRCSQRSVLHMFNREQAAPLPLTPPAEDLPPRRWGEWWIEQLIRAAGLSTIVIIGLIFLFLVREGLPAFIQISPRQFLSARWYPIENL